ncbi:MAG: hypothetical protein U0892_01840 [Pirellulales bacterium]
MASSVSRRKVQQLSNSVLRRLRLRRAIVEALEPRMLMASDLLLQQTQSSLIAPAPNSGIDFQMTLQRANSDFDVAADARAFLDNVVGTAAGDMTAQPWFPLVNSAYDQWVQDNGLAFTYTASPAEGESGLVAEGEAGGPRLLSVAPNSGDIFSFNGLNTLNVSPTELVLRFDRAIDANTIQSGIKVTKAGNDGNFSSGNETPVTFTALQGDSPLIVIARFPTTLADDTYRVDVLGDNNTGAIRDTGSKTLQPRLTTTSKDTVDFRLQLGAQVVAVVPQPVDRLPSGALSPQLDKIRVYFNNDDLDPISATNPNFYQLIFTSDTVRPNDDVRFIPTSVSYDPAADMAELTFSGRIDQLAGAGTYRLRVGSSTVVNSVTNLPNVGLANPATDASDYFANAYDLNGVLGSGFARVNETLQNVANPLPLDFPGSDLDIGNRDIDPSLAGKADNHVGASGDSDPSIPKYTFSFMKNVSYGNDAAGRPLYTVITPDQEARVREIFDFYSKQLGVDFEETDIPGNYNVVVGDLFPTGETSGPGGPAGLGGGGMAVMDSAENWDNSFGGGFFGVAIHEVGHMLGLGHTYDLPPGTTMGSYSGTANDGTPSAQTTSSSNQFPGLNDVIHGQFLYRPDNKDVDLYRFTIGANQSKHLKTETIAERLADSSSADTVITLYKATPAGLEVVASNDDYFSSDSFLEMDVDGGATGTTYYIAVTTSGNQDFQPNVSNSGSGGTSSGQYQLVVDLQDKNGVSLVDTSGTPLDGDGDGLAGGDFNFWFRAAAPVGIAAPNSPKTVFVDKDYSGVSIGSPAQPFSSLAAAVAVLTPGDILRVIGSVGTDKSLSTTSDNKAYELGRGGFANGILSDGLTFQVPKGVTMMIDAGAIFKLKGSRITAGSIDANSDFSFSSIQVLGTPTSPVYFTSYNDESLGVDTNPIATLPATGDWAGIQIHNDVDRAQGRGDYERQGIFLNYIAQADIRYGGGQVTVVNPSPAINPIYLGESRPTLLFNKISLSADAAISADADSFEETLFTEPRYQKPYAVGDLGYRPDYDRIGPSIHGNLLTNNSVNGLFIRVPTAPGKELAALNVAGRLDDTDIVYVLGENLIINGTPGGSFSEVTKPSTSVVNGTISSGGSLAAGAYSYKITFVDRFGGEGVPSDPINVNVATAGSTVQLNGLPAASGDFFSRRIWAQRPRRRCLLLGFRNQSQ